VAQAFTNTAIFTSKILLPTQYTQRLHHKDTPWTVYHTPEISDFYTTLETFFN
jgi:hypothetical protein